MTGRPASGLPAPPPRPRLPTPASPTAALQEEYAHGLARVAGGGWLGVGGPGGVGVSSGPRDEVQRQRLAAAAAEVRLHDACSIGYACSCVARPKQPYPRYPVTQLPPLQEPWVESGAPRRVCAGLDDPPSHAGRGGGRGGRPCDGVGDTQPHPRVREAAGRQGRLPQGAVSGRQPRIVL